MISAMYPEGKGGLKSRYVSGILKFFNAAGAYVYGIDPVNKKVIIPSGAEFVLESGATATFADEILAGADIAIADGKILIGDVGGAGAAKSLSGDVSMTREGVSTIAAAAVTLAKMANLATDTFIGRDTNGTGVPEAISAANALTMLGAAAGVAAGYKIARGTRTQVAASDTVVTGLATVVAVVYAFKSAPTVNQLFCAASVGDQVGTPAAGSFLATTYKPTAVNNVTPTAATDFTDNLTFDWIAIGT